MHGVKNWGTSPVLSIPQKCKKIMYWKIQEGIVFGSVVFLVFAIQAASIFLLKDSTINLWSALLVVINILIFLGVILYAKWLWKKINYLQAFIKVVKLESMMLLVILFIGVLTYYGII